MHQQLVVGPASVVATMKGATLSHMLTRRMQARHVHVSAGNRVLTFPMCTASRSLQTIQSAAHSLTHMRRTSSASSATFQWHT